MSSVSVTLMRLVAGLTLIQSVDDVGLERMMMMMITESESKKIK